MISREQALAGLTKVMSDVYLPTFLAKLASDYGIHPSSQEDVSNLLQIAATLASAPQAAQVGETKMASGEAPVTVFLRDAAESITRNALGVSNAGLQKEMIIQETLRQQMQMDPILKQAALAYGQLAIQHS